MYYVGSEPPTNTSSHIRCDKNEYQQFLPEAESTNKCPGDILHADFFYAYDGVYVKRKRILFNLYAFPEYRNKYNKPPEINILGCDFEYFLGGYESLINVETNNFIRQDRVMAYVGAERGAIINIRDSVFKHSRFCRGMVVYRRQ